MVFRKKPNILHHHIDKPDAFHSLPDDLVLSILSNLGSVADSPSDIIGLRLTCKRLNKLVFNPMVLSTAGLKALDINPLKWSESAHRFLQHCVFAGNLEACYILGMIHFYCLDSRDTGSCLMAKAAMKSHALALYSLAIIHFNGSGACFKSTKSLRTAVALCARAACLGHVDALRELGHALQDGYGVPRNIPSGRCLLIQANTRELASVLKFPTPPFVPLPLLLTWKPLRNVAPSSSPLQGSVRSPVMSDYGWNLPAKEMHPANRFLVGWFGSHGLGSRSVGLGLGICRYGGCGRPETRTHEFRRCSVCNTATYCSRGCQALDWKTRHRAECRRENTNGRIIEDFQDNAAAI